MNGIHTTKKAQIINTFFWDQKGGLQQHRINFCQSGFQMSH